MNIRKTITSEIEWNTIKKAQADGKLQELLQVGDELDITLKTGEELTVQAVGTTEHGLIFLLKDCMKDEHGMNKRMTNKGGWRDSEMRLWLNGTIIHMLPDELREMIVPHRADRGRRTTGERGQAVAAVVHRDVRQGRSGGLGTGGHRRDAAGAVQNGTQPRERETGERYMVVLAPLSVWQQLHVFLHCPQQRQRQLRQRELCVWRGLRLLPLI